MKEDLSLKERPGFIKENSVCIFYSFIIYQYSMFWIDERTLKYITEMIVCNDWWHKKQMQRTFSEFEITPIKPAFINSCFQTHFTDLEDALQYQCAFHAKATIILTKDISDFFDSKIPVIHPHDFVVRYNELMKWFCCGFVLANLLQLLILWIHVGDWLLFTSVVTDIRIATKLLLLVGGLQRARNFTNKKVFL